MKESIEQESTRLSIRNLLLERQGNFSDAAHARAIPKLSPSTLGGSLVSARSNHTAWADVRITAIRRCHHERWRLAR